MGSEERRVKDIMSPIAEYAKIDADAPLCEALEMLKKYNEKIKAGVTGIHKTMLVTDNSGRIVGKLSLYAFIKGLVPEHVKDEKISRKFYSLLSSRALEVADEIKEMQDRFQWLHSTFSDLVQQETRKKVKDVMSPIQHLLKEEDTINKAIFVMFKENIRQPVVVRDGEIVGIVNLMGIFAELLKIACDECTLPT
jgi:predicted transcriptional regulator